MHALVIGIDDYTMWKPCKLPDLKGSMEDAKRMGDYLEETLHVPCHQIRRLYNSHATKERIVEELKGLSHRGSVAKDAPIVIYYAGHSDSTDGGTSLVPYLPNYANVDGCTESLRSNMLTYGEIVELLRHIGDEKTENIALILDTCHAGAMATVPPTPEGVRFPLPPANLRRGKARDILAGHPSHVLLAAAAPDENAFEAASGGGGQFTAALLHILRHAEEDKTLKTMTYKKLTEEICKFKISCEGYKGPLGELQSVHCTSIHQDRPLFDGLFHRKRDDDSCVPVVTVRYSE